MEGGGIVCGSRAIWEGGLLLRGDFMSKEFDHLIEILTSCGFMMATGLLRCMSPKYCVVVVGQMHGDWVGYLDCAYDCGEGCTHE